MNPNERLLAAVRAGDLDALRAALKAGADPDAQHEYEEVFDRERIAGTETVLQYAARSSHHDIVAALLAAGASPDTRDTVRGRSPLVEAAARGERSIVGALLAAGAPVGDAAFATAIERGHAAVAAMLATAGADATPRALELACHHGSVELADLCVQRGADVAAAEALETAARVGSVAMVQWALANGVGLAVHGEAALCEAANAGQTAVVARLLDLGVPPRCRNSYGWTPLHFAAYQADPATCAALLRAGADPRDDDGAGRTAIDWAREAGKTANVELLERALHDRS